MLNWFLHGLPRVTAKTFSLAPLQNLSARLQFCNFGLLLAVQYRGRPDTTATLSRSCQGRPRLSQAGKACQAATRVGQCFQPAWGEGEKFARVATELSWLS